ncbi:MAG TPA: glycosyltransferase family A protein [Glaciihabitans sp.]|nr:glycosyltransferase family A protein [Glaciihabitans sp.]
MSGIHALAIVIPARDEEALINECLTSVLAAIAEAQRHHTLQVSVVVVADGCTDNTATIARGFDGVQVTEIDEQSVGAARAHGVALALTSLEADPTSTWIANTDADSAVPLNWVSEQLALAEHGVQVMIGTVRPDFTDLIPAQIIVWKNTHPAGVANGHVHAANLGMTAKVYLAAGGFPNQPEHEDADLVAELKRQGANVQATHRCEVVTSGRQVGRTPGGYAGFLRTQLVEQVNQSE